MNLAEAGGHKKRRIPVAMRHLEAPIPRIKRFHDGSIGLHKKKNLTDPAWSPEESDTISLLEELM